MEYNITHHYTGHSDILYSSPSLEEAKVEFARLISEWGEPDPSDQFLELWATDEEYNLREIEDHLLVEWEDWESQD